jgi:deoxyribonuclease-4
MTKFGPAGLADSFKIMGYKKSEQAREYLEKFSLTAFEYQFGHGVRLKTPKAKVIGDAFAEKHIQLSAHAPYYISMASRDEEKRLNSVKYILQTARALREMGGKRIVFHPGSLGKFTRKERLNRAMDTLSVRIDSLDENGFGDMIICPEVMGKINQLGNLDEVLTLCKLDKRIYPCIDFGHLNSRTHGSLKTKDDFLRVVVKINDTLEDDRYKYFHSHFSKIQWGKGGEKRHLTFADREFGPDFLPFVEIIAENHLSPVVICESAGTQTEDAALMMNTLYDITKKEK